MWGRIVNDVKAELDNARFSKISPDKKAGICQPFCVNFLRTNL